MNYNLFQYWDYFTEYINTYIYLTLKVHTDQHAQEWHFLKLIKQLQSRLSWKFLTYNKT